jgi:ABC-type nickel/cobalt efflux system permease component RcnA
VQTIQIIVAVITIAAIMVAVLIRARQATEVSPMLVLSGIVLVALVGGLVVVAMSFDLVPDEVEQLLLPFVLLVVAPVLLAVMFVLERRG